MSKIFRRNFQPPTDETPDPLPLPVPFVKLAGIYRVSQPALRKASRKLLLRPGFMENPVAIRFAMLEDGYNRGKLRKMVFDESECARIHAEVELLRYPKTDAPQAK